MPEDKIYYQQLIAKKDANQLAALKKQIVELSNYTQQIEEQKQSILYSMTRIQNKKNIPYVIELIKNNKIGGVILYKRDYDNLGELIDLVNTLKIK